MKIKQYDIKGKNNGSLIEVCTKDNRLFFDFGSNIIDEENNKYFDINGLTSGKKADALFLSCQHGYQTPVIPKLMDNIEVYMSYEAFNINDIKEKTLNIKSIESKNVFLYEPMKKIEFTDVKVTPFKCCNNEVDNYMFLIEGEGCKILHTGKLKLDGFYAKNKMGEVKSLIKKCDMIITTGLTIYNKDSKYMSERESQLQLLNILDDYKYLFVIASSNDIDRLCSFYHIGVTEKMVVASPYIYAQLNYVTNSKSFNSNFYRLKKLKAYNERLFADMNKKGFLMFVEPSRDNLDLINRFNPQKTQVIYSMWDGYLDENEFQDNCVREFINHWKYINISSKGDLTIEEVVDLINNLKPKKGIVCINQDNPFEKMKFSKKYPLITLPTDEYFNLHGDSKKDDSEELDLEQFNYDHNFDIGSDSDSEE